MRREVELRHLRNKLSKMHQDVYELKHYLTIRCPRRKTYEYKLHRVNAILKRLEETEGRYAEMFGRKKLTIRARNPHLIESNKRVYPLYINCNDNNRLKSLLNNNLRGYFVRRLSNKVVVQLDQKEYSKLKHILKG